MYFVQICSRKSSSASLGIWHRKTVSLSLKQENLLMFKAHMKKVNVPFRKYVRRVRGVHKCCQGRRFGLNFSLFMSPP
jgi:hypothetical protein